MRQAAERAFPSQGVWNRGWDLGLGGRGETGGTGSLSRLSSAEKSHSSPLGRPLPPRPHVCVMFACLFCNLAAPLAFALGTFRTILKTRRRRRTPPLNSTLARARSLLPGRNTKFPLCCYSTLERKKEAAATSTLSLSLPLQIASYSGCYSPAER